MTPYVDGPSESGAMDALQIISADRDTWKERAITAEEQLREVKRLIIEMSLVNDRLEEKSNGLMEVVKSAIETITLMRKEAGQSVWRKPPR